jgi:hypothetical protein
MSEIAPPETPMNNVAFTLIVLRSSDLARAVAFYSQLGLQFTCHQHESGSKHFAAQRGAVVFELYPLSPNQPSTRGTRIGFSVPPSLGVTLAALSEHPSSVVSPPKDSEWRRRAIVVDPDEHRLELVQQ